tara:strand:- start:703 stop:861 length:159 start_codon:yes stop_codon:yes gene_type:complete
MLYDVVLYSEGAFQLDNLYRISFREVQEIQERMSEKAKKTKEAMNPKKTITY